MEAIRVQQTIERDGELLIEGIPFSKGQIVEITMLLKPVEVSNSRRLTVQEFRESGLIGLWKDRDDIQDTLAYARNLREQAQNRRGNGYDSVG
ncbi:MAG TPA: hypothetical protein ENJ56_01255 [Anaerolineae bacterium]|nr:hypothetical protein [Anaerolineae bacterium]